MDITQTLTEIWRSLVVIGLFYFFPYLVAKGFYEGKYSSVDKKRVCDICWRDINKVNDCLKKQSK